MPKNGDRDRLTSALLAEPAPHAVRVIALARLAQARGAYDRYADGDPEGLHDLRVALRRLRSWLRAFRPQLDDTLRGQTRRRLNALADATNTARDAEVALAWIASLGQPAAPARMGTKAIVRTLEHECGDAERDVRRQLARGFPKVIKRLSVDLGAYVESMASDDGRGTDAAPRPKARAETMANAYAGALREQSTRLEKALSRIESVDDGRHMHRARIEGKRLRYLLEAMPPGAAVADLLTRLRDMQQQLGDVRDSQRLASRLVKEIGQYAARDARRHTLDLLGLGQPKGRDARFASLRAGLEGLATSARARQQSAFGAFQQGWGAASIRGFLDDVSLVSDRQSSNA